MIPAFPKIWALGAPDISNIFNGPVEVTEKVDGSQIGFGRTNTGEFVIRSKGTEIYRDTVGFLRQPDGLFKDAVAYLLTIKDKVSTDTHYYGEVIAKQKHNTLTYGRVPDNSVILYAKRTPEGFVSNRIELLGAASALDLEVVPVLLNGTVNSSSELNSLLDTDSFLGGCKIEGVVVKNYAQSSNSPYSTYCFGKYVSDRFKEMHTSDWAERKKSGSLQEFMESFTNQNRWEKAIQHLRDDGKLTSTPKDIGPLIVSISRDIETEYQQMIKDKLWDLFKKSFTQYAIKGFPEFYKKQLMENAFVKTEA